jgi:hypothetical protein
MIILKKENNNYVVTLEFCSSLKLYTVSFFCNNELISEKCYRNRDTADKRFNLYFT